MKSNKNSGFAAIIVFVIVLVLAVAAGIAWVHYIYLPKMAAQNIASSPTVVVATTSVAVQPPATTTQKAVVTSTAPLASNFIGSLETCSKGSGTIAGLMNYYWGSSNGTPTVIIGYDTTVNITGVSNQNCIFTVHETKITSFNETALGKSVATAPAATTEAQMQQTMSSAPPVTCTVPESTIASVAATFSDPMKFDAFLNSSACGS